MTGNRMQLVVDCNIGALRFTEIQRIYRPVIGFPILQCHKLEYEILERNLEQFKNARGRSKPSVHTTTLKEYLETAKCHTENSCHPLFCKRLHIAIVSRILIHKIHCVRV